MKSIAWLGAAALAGVLAVQEPGKAPPQDPPPGSQEKAGKRAAKGVPLRDPIEGVYALRARVIGGERAPGGSQGYVAVSGRHMLLVLAASGSVPDRPLLRAGVRTWKREKAGVRTVIDLGFFTDEDGDVYLEKPGTSEMRRVDLARGMLRIWQDETSYLEFERLE